VPKVNIEDFLTSLEYYIDEKVEAAINAHENNKHEENHLISTWRWTQRYQDLCDKLNEIFKEPHS